MAEIVKGKIGNALTSTAADHVVAVANDVFDEELEQYQGELNQENKGVTGLLGITNLPDSSFIDGYYINTGVGVGNTVDMEVPVANAAYRYLRLECEEGDSFVVNGTGGYSPRLYAFLSPFYEVLDVASANLSGKNIRITAPEGTAFVVFNDNVSSGKGTFFKNNGGGINDLPEKVADIEEQVAGHETAISELENKPAITQIQEIVHDEFVYAVVDKDGRILGGYKTDGSVYIPKGMSEDTRKALDELAAALQSEIDERTSLITTSESGGKFVAALVDKDNRVLIGVNPDGSVYIPKGMSEDAKSALEAINKRLAAIDELISVVEHYTLIGALVDSENRLLIGVDKEGNVRLSKNLSVNGAAVEVVETVVDTLYHVIDKDGRYLASIDSKGHLKIQNGLTIDGLRTKFETTESQQFLFGIVDVDGHLLCGIDKNGAVVANKIIGCGKYEEADNEEFAIMFVDADNRLLFGVKRDGTFYSPKFQLSYMCETEDMEFVYVILDAQGRICWGISSNGSCYQPKGIPEEVRTELAGIKSMLEKLNAITEDINISELQNNNIAINKVMYDGNQGRAYLGNVALQEPGKTDYCIIMMYGQSLSNGSENPAGFYDQPTDNCFMLGSNVWNTTGTTLQALSCGGTKRGDGVCTGTRQDTIISTVNAFVNMYKKERPWDKNTKFIACSLGVGGRTVAQLSGAARYPYCNEHHLDARVKPCFQAVKAIADNEGKTISLSAVFWKQGESDYGTGHIGKTYDEWKAAATAQAQTAAYNMSMSGSKDAYYRGLTLLKEDIFALAKEIFGDDQQNRPVFMPYSVCGTYINNAYMTINEATAQMADEQDDVVQVGPTYVTPDYNGGHLAMNGYRWFGEYCAKALYNVFLKGIDWHPLQPYNYEVQGNKIYIYMNTPVPPLRFDKYTLDNAYKTNGFTVRMGTVEQLDAAKSMTSNSALIQTITDIAIVENCVVLTCGNIEEFEGAVEVTYAGQGQSGYNGHNQGAGNLRDSDTWQALNEYRNDAGDHGSRTTFSNWSAATASESDKETLEEWSAEKTYSYGDKVLYEHSNGTTYRLTSNKDNNTGTPYSSGTTLRTSNRWNGSTKATSEELEELEYLDENYLSATGYSYGDKVLFDVIEQDGPIVLTSNYGGASGGLNKTRPFNPVNYRPVDVKGESIVGKKYPMQNWCLNFYKRIILG